MGAFSLQSNNQMRPNDNKILLENLRIATAAHRRDPPGRNSVIRICHLSRKIAKATSIFCSFDEPFLLRVS